MREQRKQAAPAPSAKAEPSLRPAKRPPYEPPRITKKRSLSRATLFTGSGPSAGGLVGHGAPGDGTND